ncbi:MAG: helix-turn-helix transcriptional regulator [Phycisphaeraceae bacterium]|nr:helix-turn-helix transcriptional regulator [Phycisphaeraceae bacterium]
MASPRKPIAQDNVEPLDPATQALCEQVSKLRKKRGWSLGELSMACAVSRSMLSQIEHAKVNPTLAVAHRIAQAFGVSLGQMLDAFHATANIEVIRADDRTYHYRSDRHCRIRTLSPLHLEKDVEFYEVSLKLKGALRSAAHFQGTREFITVQQGHIRITSGKEITELGPGDSAHYNADIKHTLENFGKDQATAFLVVIYEK